MTDPVGVGASLTGQGKDPLRHAVQKSDGEFADDVMKAHEESINITRKESYINAQSVIALQAAKDGKKEVEWDKLNPDQLAEVLASSKTTGISEAEAKIRFERDGPNELEKPKRPTLAMLFLLQILNLIILLLVAAACASLIVNATGSANDDWTSYVESIAIFVIVILNAGIGAVTENSAAGALEALSKLSQPKAAVIRGGQEITVASTKIVKGDVVVLGVGDIVPADVRLIQAADFKVNEMLLTGEPDDVSKFARMKKKSGGGGHGGGEKLTPENMAFSSCMCTSGKATAFVVDIGMNTRVGRIAKLLGDTDGSAKKKGLCACLPDTKSNQTPLQKSLQQLGVRIGIFAILACVIVFIVGAVRGVYNISTPLDDGISDSIVYMVLISVTLAVAAIPEGIPLCVTISLSTGCSDMVKQNVLVRRIAAVETLGCASVICTDKTGTLTEGKMSMTKMWASGVDFNVSGKGFDPTVGDITFLSNGSSAKSDKGVVASLASATMCSNTKISQETDPDDGKTTWVPRGNSSEAPIIVAARKVGLDAEQLEKAFPRIFEVPFSSSRKMMLTVTEMKNQEKGKEMFPGVYEKIPDTKFVAHVKGAPNYIINDCDSWTTPEGNIVPLTADDKAKVMKRVDELSSEALRVLAIALRPVSEMPFDHTNKDLEMTADDKFTSLVKQEGLILLGLVASIDPERDGVPQAVLDAQGGHIRVVMITGDYLPTAKAIAFNVNILKKGDDVTSAALDSGKLRPNGEYLPDADIDYLTKTVKVFARAQPEDKLQIVKSLQRQGLVCAMTGDGVNDAPALKRADIGVAMGIQGTEVAKGASDMILTDDNFCSIVNAVEKGRIIYAGIQKFVAFIMSVHFAEVLQIFLCIIANIPIMRTPLQILFLILVTDLPPSVALGMERVARDILKDRPRPKEQPIVLMWQWQGIVANGIVLTITTMAVYIWGLNYWLDSNFLVPRIADLFCGEGGCDALRETIEADDSLNAEDALNEEFVDGLVLARTAAFISLVYSENVRAYTSRSFTDPVWVDLCANTSMQKAIFFAQVALYCAVFIPGLNSDIFELDGKGIGLEGWIAAWLGGLSTLIFCELYKWGTHGQVKLAEKKVADKLKAADEERQALAEARRKKMADDLRNQATTA
jgi:potassium/sodium efflux P-type ATPase